MSEFMETFDKHFKTLESYVPVVAKVHGGTHPEFLDVKDLYEKIRDKVQAGKIEDGKLNDDFEKLRGITGNYRNPGDTCETYEAVYNMLMEIDQAYDK